MATAARERLRRLLQLGFWFFLIKGLLWLLLPLLPLLALWLGWHAHWR